jgi:SAM-dependent methyltransferase
MHRTENCVAAERCSVPCNLCGDANVRILATKSRGGTPLRTVICLRCGLVWSDPLPHNPREFYEKEYRLSYKGTFTPKPKHILRAGGVAVFRYTAIRDFMPESGIVLDVGSGGGEFLYLLRKAGFDVRGIEPNVGYAEYSAREYDLAIWNGFVQDAVFPENSIDAITVWHVLEHTEDPFHVLQKAYGFLKPGGRIIIEVPNVEAVCQSPSSIFHEAHIYNFNPVTLETMAQKSGFSPVSISISPDGGNILLIAQKDAGQNGLPSHCGYDSHNAERIIQIIQGHVGYKYRLSLTPYTRLCRRIGRMIQERWGLFGYTNGRAALENMFTSVIKKRLPAERHYH